MTSDDEHLKFKFDESDLADCAETLNGEELYCEARVVLWCAARIRELEAEMEKYNTANVIMAMEKAASFAKTHVIVPVEPTEAMLKAGQLTRDNGAATNTEIYVAMIRAAQPVARKTRSQVIEQGE